MSTIDVGRLLTDVTADAPCGSDPEYDPTFLELVREAQGKPQMEMGDQVIPAVPPNWKAVCGKAQEILTRAKDLRVATYLCRGLLSTDGLVGLASGLELLVEMVRKYWDGVHPVLDPDDGNDPVMRINALSLLGDRDLMVASLRETPLVSSRALGRFSQREIDIAAGRQPAPAGMDTPPEMSVIEAAFMDCDPDELQATFQACEVSAAATAELGQLLQEKAGQKPDFDPLREELGRIGKTLGEQLKRRGIGLPVPEPAATDGGAAAATTASAAAAAPAMNGEITSRTDVVNALDRVIEYYRQREPTSPVPLLIERAKGLVHKDFLEIIRDLAPDVLAQVEKIRGGAAQK